MENYTSIYCPDCKHRVMRWDNKSKNVFEVKCRKCNHLVVFDSINLSVDVKKQPIRNTSSGMRFY